jgi:ATP-binding cassette subfamily B (MDR/TAP) protein 1
VCFDSHIASLADAAVALTTLRRQIERRPFIDIRDPSGITLPTEKHALQLRGGTADSHLAAKGQSDWKPEFELRNVTFAYPSRPAVKSLDDVSLRIEPGKMTAFVGHSGSGKSTTVGLLLREYDPETGNLRNPSDEDTGLEEDTIQTLADDVEVVSNEDEKHDEAQTAKKSRLGGLFGAKDKHGDLEKASRKEAEERSRVQGSGTVLFAGRDIREYNLQWYRQQISVVSQAPQLFSTSIFGNVAAGLTGTEFEYRPERDTLDSDDAGTRERMAMIRELVKDALRKAQAWEFVSRLPEGMDTVITGGRAQLLSGGQRQRVALARALVSKPAVLLLDEATSALDTASEDKIRKMLEIEQKERGMSLIVVAHRMSTIVSADKIFVMQSGKVVDEGTYDELLETDRKDQTFRNMVLANQEQQRADTVDEKIAYENDVNGITADDQSGIFSNTSTVGILPEGSGMSTPPNLSINRSNSTGTKRPDLHMLYSGRGSNFGRMDHTIDGPVGMAGTVNPPVAEEEEASEGSSPSDEKPDAMDVQRPDPLKPRRYSKGALLRSYWRIMAGRKWWFLLGVVCSIAAGAGWPIEGWMVRRSRKMTQRGTLQLTRSSI